VRKAAHPSRRSKVRHIIVVGTGEGGLETLDALIGQLPTNLAAAILIVQHLTPDDSGEALTRRLGRHTAFDAKLAIEGERLTPGRIYIAPPDNHLLLRADRILVRKGARENRSRPGVDPLFRSAAVASGSRVIGVVLTGLQDDGAAGLIAIKRCGGVTVVQDPKDAAYSAMPQSALDRVDVDYCVPIADMAQLLATLVSKPPRKTTHVPSDIRIEAEIAERVLSDVAQVEGLGAQVPYNCPNCGGVLWQMVQNSIVRYRCHTGHSYTDATLLLSQTEAIEETLWVALRMFEERKNLLSSMQGSGKGATAGRIREAQGHIERIRAILCAPGVSEEPPDADG